MNENKKKTLQRRSALLLATVLCISAMAGCGTATQKKATEKTPTQQSQQAAPKADTAKKDAAKKAETKKDAGKKTSANKPAGSQSSTGKPAGNQTGAGKKSDASKTAKPAAKPAVGQSKTVKPAIKPAAKPAAEQNKAAKPAAPAIKTQPKDVKTAVGKTCTFTISADGTNLKYFWQVNKNDGKSWADIPGANESSYTLKNAGADQNGWQFRCVVRNDAGNAESAVATLSVDSSVKPKQG